ncbi:Blp family class II bacteriocin [Streptococcus sp. P25B114]|nr:hypothetical protein [Streptococcus suis]NQM28720.1 hypothetical protein [Streptococcus suis]NRG98806.1 hypothetical protein [Streptococcus suis]HEM2752776.1 Blp family class II bacteriocin [Streptococcus suis]HEM4252310.1 Blp family class II bacteriocin [Streptococcus suis]
MNTKTMERFEMLDSELLMNIDGGYNAGACLTDIGLGMVGGVAAGWAGGPYTIALGVALGQIGGSVKCITSYLGGK